MKHVLIQKIKGYGPGFLFLLPIMLFIILFIGYPIVQSIILSFFKWKGYGPWEFIGIENYIEIISDTVFIESFTNSLTYSFSASAGTLIIGLLIALVIHLKVPGWKTYRVLFVLPIMVMQVAVALMWSRVLAPDGLFNGILGFLNLELLQRAWLGDINTAMLSIILITIWQYSGFPMIFFLAGLQNIDEEIYEAAIIDGASTIRRVFTITIPLVRNIIAVVFLLQVIYTFKVFDLVWFLTRGGPAYSTEVLGIRLYSEAFSSRNFGYASVISLTMIIVAVIFSIFYTKLSGYGREKKIGK